MATFDPISYTYKPTAPRSKSTNTRRKYVSNQSSILDKFQHKKLSNIAFDGSQLSALTAVDYNGGYKSVIQETGTCYSSSSGDDDDDYLPTVEEILYPTLQKKSSTTTDPSPDDIALGVDELVSEESGVINYGTSAPGDNPSGSLDDPIDLLGSDDSSSSEAEIDDGSLCTKSAEPDADHFHNPETVVNLTTRAPSSSPYKRQDIDDFLDIPSRPQLTEQKASTSDSMRPDSPPSNELLHDRIDIEGFCTRWARSDSARPQSPPPCQSGASPENQLSEEDYLSIDRSVVDEHEHDHELAPSVLNTRTFDEGGSQQQEVEAEEAADENNDEDDGQQREVNGVATALTPERVSDTHLSSKDGSPRPAERQQLLPSRDPSPETSHDEAGSYSDSYSDDELNNKTVSDDDNRKPRPAKRKRRSSSYDSPTPKKRRCPFQQRSARQPEPRSEPRRRSPKSHSLLDQGSSIVAVSSTERRLPSVPHTTDTDMSPDCGNPGRSSEDVLPTLTEVTFRPHSPYCCSFTAVIQDDCDERGVSFSQLTRLIASIGHVGKIDDFAIKPIEQCSFLLTGFSRHTSSRLSSSSTTISTTAEAGRNHVDKTRTRFQHGRVVDAGALASQRSEPSSSDDDGGLSGSDPESSSDEDGCSSEADQGRLSTSKQSRWSGLDEQRLLAYKKEGKSWDWIFGKFPGRTRPAIRTRWNMIRPRGE